MQARAVARRGPARCGVLLAGLGLARVLEGGGELAPRARGERQRRARPVLGVAYHDRAAGSADLDTVTAVAAAEAGLAQGRQGLI